MIVLGFNGFPRIAEFFARLYGHTPDSVDRHSVLGHDAAAALFVDRVLVAAVEEERLNRQKKTSAFPIHAIEWCLEQASISYDDVDHFAFGWNFSDAYADAAIREIAASPFSAAEKFQALSSLGILYGGALSREAVLRDFRASTGYDLPDSKLISVDHHRAHIACGGALAGFEEAAFFISDGRSESHSAILGEIRGSNITTFHQLTIDSANSVAQLYAEVTRYLGFVPNQDEYKVMALAGFAEPYPVEDNPLLHECVSLEPNGRYSLRLAQHPLGMRAYESLLDALFEVTPDDRTEFDVRVRVASAMQQVVEIATAHQLDALAHATGLRRLLFEGGLALNCVNNTKLLEGSTFDEIEVSFGASDCGIAIGAAAAVVAEHLGLPRLDPSPYVGPEYSRDEIASALMEHQHDLAWEEMSQDQMIDRAADLLCGETVVGWFQGRTEYGPRALGNRSLLANPSIPGMKETINERVKHREPFRPFAPILLEEDAPRLFEMGKKERSPYMTFVFPARRAYASKLTAALHVDGTARIQTVTDASSPLIARLLRTFTARSGVPGLVNTSFNVAGEPIVCSPADAVRCFLATEIDYLIMGNFIVGKRGGRGT